MVGPSADRAAHRPMVSIRRTQVKATQYRHNHDLRRIPRCASRNNLGTRRLNRSGNPPCRSPNELHRPRVSVQRLKGTTRAPLALPTDVFWVRDAFLDHLVPSVPRSLVVARVLFHLRSAFSSGLFQSGLVNVVCRAGAEGCKQQATQNCAPKTRKYLDHEKPRSDRAPTAVAIRSGNG